MTGLAKFKLMAAANRRAARGFTLTEAIMVIVITGILASMVAVFIQKPVAGFFDTARRAALADAADTVYRRVSRDLRAALPNSVRVNAGGTALEFLHVRSGGRYREQVAPGPVGNTLDFSLADTSFDVLGPSLSVQAGDSVVVYNLGIPGADAYEGVITNRRVAAAPFGAALASVALASATRFDFASPAKRFQIVDTPVSYVCSGAQMLRYSGYAILPAQPVPPAVAGALIAGQISACSFAYAPGPNQSQALVTLRLNLSEGGETISLLYQVHVNNVP